MESELYLFLFWASCGNSFTLALVMRPWPASWPGSLQCFGGGECVGLYTYFNSSSSSGSYLLSVYYGLGLVLSILHRESHPFCPFFKADSYYLHFAHEETKV